MSVAGVDPHSPVWRALKRHIEAEIETVRTALEASGADVQTHRLQGRVRAYRALITQVEDRFEAQPQ